MLGLNPIFLPSSEIQAALPILGRDVAKRSSDYGTKQAIAVFITILAICVILTLVYGFRWCIRRRQNKRFGSRGQGNHLAGKSLRRARRPGRFTDTEEAISFDDERELRSVSQVSFPTLPPRTYNPSLAAPSSVYSQSISGRKAAMIPGPRNGFGPKFVQGEHNLTVTPSNTDRPLAKNHSMHSDHSIPRRGSYDSVDGLEAEIEHNPFVYPSMTGQQRVDTMKSMRYHPDDNPYVLPSLEGKPF